jgi:integrase
MGSRYSMTLKRDAKSGAFKDRIRLPEDVRREYQALYGPAWEEKFCSAAGTLPAKALAEHAAWAAKIKSRIAALRDGKGDNGVDLTQREADALAGDWYRWYVEQHQDNPGSPDGYDLVRYDLWRTAVEAGDPETDEADFDDPEVLSEVATQARASQFLTDRGIALSQAGRTRFLASLIREFLAATSLLERRARGDWGPDKHLDQLAPANHSLAAIQRVRNPVRGASALTATELFQAYVADKHPAPRTVTRWQGVFTALDAAGWQAPGWDAQVWLDSLKAEKHVDGTPLRKPITVRDIWLGAPRAVFSWAVRHKKATHNPFAGCVVEVPRAKVTRETGRAFTEAEAVTILRAALTTPINPKHPLTAAKRWVPWIAAYTGARAGELTQLRRQDVESRTGVGWVIRITPEAGTVKTGEVRVVPLHADLVKQGFPAWVERQQSGPLFYHRPAKSSRSPKYRGVKAVERLAKWVRSLGIDDPEVKPNHGWRHTFKSRAIQAGIDARVRDAIVGHAPRTVADKYEHPTVADMAKALKRFPRYAVE